jgi:hypothetical protein
MAFNANSYRRNKWRREALGYIAKAREYKATGVDSWRIESAVKLARITWRLYRSQAVICDIDAKRRSL